MIDYGDGHLTVRAIKRQIDGALGSRGAWLLEPYTDKPDSTGLNTTPVDVDPRDREAGDRQRLPAVRARDRRPRQSRDAEHLRGGLQGESRTRRICAGASSTRSTSTRRDIPRFGQLGVIASMQGIHCTSDAPYVLARLGDAARRGRRVRLAEADEERRDRRQRHRRAGRGRRPDRRATTRPSAASRRTARCSTRISA